MGRHERREEKTMPKTIEELPMLLTPRQLAEVIGEHVNSVRRGIAEGRIPAFKVNGRIYISREAAFQKLPTLGAGDWK